MSAKAGTLILFCKPPQSSKQRLIPALGERPTFELAELLLGCALEDAGAWPGPVVLSPAREADRAWARSLPVDHARVVPQTGGNLGERLNDIDQRLRDEGHEKLVFIGLDCPLLDTAALLGALGALETRDAVLGAAEDGGVVFMGNARPWPPLARLPWSTPALATALAEACEQAGLGVGWQGRWPDVDRASDLAPLAAALKSDGRPARQRLSDWLGRRIQQPGKTDEFA